MFIKNYYKSFLIYFIITFAPQALHAQSACTEDGNPVICNPLEAENIQQLLAAVVEIIVTLSIPVIVVAIIYSGFLFVTAGGDKDQIDTAKRAALYTLIGAGIIIGADVILTVLQNTAADLGAGNINGSE